MNDFAFKFSSCAIIIVIMMMVSPELFQGTAGLLTFIGFVAFFALSYYFSEPMDLDK